jgi:hypothetical protein
VAPGEFEILGHDSAMDRAIRCRGRSCGGIIAAEIEWVWEDAFHSLLALAVAAMTAAVSIRLRR